MGDRAAFGNVHDRGGDAVPVVVAAMGAKLAHRTAALQHGEERPAIEALIDRHVDDLALVHEGELAVQRA